MAILNRVSAILLRFDIWLLTAEFLAIPGLRFIKTHGAPEELLTEPPPSVSLQ